VILTKHHAALLAADAIEALKTLLFPHAFLLTPNLEEAGMLTRSEVSDRASMRRAAEILAAMGPKAVLVKGGHLAGDAIDILFHEGKWLEFTGPRINTRHTHGTGCTYSAAITASLALGDDLPTAVGRAKRYISEAISSNPGLGAGSGPVNHHAGVPGKELR
jgi:hydroxymethylpyrimidine/phosphomethylpyrimidine kinase